MVAAWIPKCLLGILSFVAVAPMPPKKMDSTLFNGIVWDMIRNASPKLNVLPVRTNMVLVPAAIPLRYRGTAFIIDALFGEAKTPIPVPINAKGNRVSKKVVFIPNSVSIKKPTADMKRPKGDINLDP